MRRLLGTALAVVVATSALGADLLIKGVRIDFGDGRVMESGSILIRDGKIAEIAPSVDTPGVEVMDAKGLTAFPGFIDAYSTRGLKLPDPPAAATPPSATATAPPTMWAGNRRGIRGALKAADCLNLGSTAEDARKNGIVAALLCPGGSIVRGSGALVLMTDEKQSPVSFGMDLSFRSAVGGGPAPSGGGGGGGYPGTVMGYTALLRQTLADAQVYESPTDKAKADADLEGLKSVFAGTPAIVAADSPSEITRALRIANEFGLNLWLSGARDGYRVVDEIGKTPVLASVTVGTEPTVRESADGPPVEVQEDRARAWKERASNIQRLIAAGVTVALSSEGDGPGDYLANVRKLIKLGLKREDALRAMTVTPAKLFGMDGWGKLESGADAHITLMDGDFADEKAKVKMVVVGGKKFEVKS
jgi:imidazolonepropionase-like amidohydrolase